jgi:hypothetical protein
MSNKAGWIANFLDEINLPITDDAAAELRRLAKVETNQAYLLEALQNLIEAADSMKSTYTVFRGKTPEHDDHYGHEKWAEEFLQENADAARAAIAKATGEQP